MCHCLPDSGCCEPSTKPLLTQRWHKQRWGGRLCRGDRILRRWLSLPVALLEAAVGRRGLAFLFIIACAVFSLGGWLRPPLSADLRAIHLPLLGSADASTAMQLLYGPRRFIPLSIGSVLLVVCVVGAAAVAHRPRRLGAVAAVVLLVAVAMNGAAAVNQPALLELLDEQLAQHARMVEFVTGIEEDAVSDPASARVLAPPATDAPQLPAGRGMAYLWHGRWLVALAIAGVVCGIQGSIARRVAWTGGALACGATLAAVLCLPTLRAERLARSALEREQLGDRAGARGTLAAAVSISPVFGTLERVVLLEGRLDDQDGRESAARGIYLAQRWQRSGQTARARARLVEQGERLPSTESIRARVLERLEVEGGLAELELGRPSAAVMAWERAMAAARSSLDASFLAGLVFARMSPGEPERAEALMAPMLSATADRLLRADALASLGDVYFEAGKWSQAREKYRASMRAFSLPKQINYRAQRGLVGM